MSPYDQLKTELSNLLQTMIVARNSLEEAMGDLQMIKARLLKEHIEHLEKEGKSKDRKDQGAL